MELLTLSTGIGVVVSLIFTELFGLAAGGIIVPGYIALYLHYPASVALTLGISFVTFGFMRVASVFIVLYGRRRTALMILLGYVLGMWSRTYVEGALDISTGADVAVIGYIIPGLIAIWIDRQGIVQTLTSLLTASVVVRLVLILVTGGVGLP